MAITATPALPVSATNRTVRVQIDVPYQGTPVVEVFRETLHLDGNGGCLLKDPWTSLSRTYAAVAAQSVTLSGGKTVTGAEMYEAIAAFCDMWKLEGL